MKLERFEHQGLELVINTQTGECFANQRALARMCGVSSSSISAWKGVENIQTIAASTPTAGGVQGGQLFSEGAASL